MSLIYQVCFIVGVGYAVISFLLGHVLGFINLDGDVGGADTDFDMAEIDIDAADGYPGSGMSPFKPVIIAAFLGTFGGVGLLLSANALFYFTIIISSATGLLVSFVFYRFIYIPMYRAQNTSAVEKQSLIGELASVSERIPQGGYGKITYHASGNTYTAPAKSEQGSEIKRNTNVVITSIVKNTYFVKPKGDAKPYGV